MKYNAPPGGDANAPYVDGNRSAGVKGSIVPASAVEHGQRELVHLIEFSGQSPASTDLEQVRKAIEALISAATGGGDTSQFLLVSQAQVRLPFFPEIMSADGRMNVTSPASGTIFVPPVVNFMHRGIVPLSTSDYDEPSRTFETLASRTYHLRWNSVDGFALKDLADAAYNPLVAIETDTSFDSTYDDMLVARIVTDSSNVPTITNLANKARLSTTLYATATNFQNSGENLGRGDINAPLNWARRPTECAISEIFRSSDMSNAAVQDDDLGIYEIGGHPTVASEIPVTRYGFAFTMLHDCASGFRLALAAGA